MSTRTKNTPTSWQLNEANRIGWRHGPIRQRVNADGDLVVELLADRSMYAAPTLTLVLSPTGRVVDRVAHDPVGVPIFDIDDLDRTSRVVLDEMACWLGARTIARRTGERLAVVRLVLSRLLVVDAAEERRSSGGSVEYRARRMS